jgi:hypothetical protein
MTRLTIASVTLLTLAGLARAGGDQVFSGPQPGEKLTAFKVHAFSGPAAGKEIQLLADPKDTPRVLVFIHELNRLAFQLLRPVDQYAARLHKDGLETHFIMLTADRAKTEQYLEGAQKALALAAPIVISLDGIEGPGNYGLNRKVTLTVLVARGNKVVANFAIVQPNDTDAPKVAAAIAKLMGKTPPTAEELGIGGKDRPKDRGPDSAEALQKKIRDLEDYIDKLTDALNQAREQIAKLEGKPAPKPLPKLPRDDRKPAGKGSANPELQKLMRQMIQMDNDAATVERIAAAMTTWAGDDATKQAELRDYCRLVVQLGYGTDAAKKALAKLAGD